MGRNFFTDFTIVPKQQPGQHPFRDAPGSLSMMYRVSRFPSKHLLPLIRISYLISTCRSPRSDSSINSVVADDNDGV